jgi:2'-5' RNA ligase
MGLEFYLRWLISRGLIRLRDSLIQEIERINNMSMRSEFEWFPKSTLAYKDTNLARLSELLLLVEDIDFKYSCRVDALALYRYSLNEGEVKIGEYRLRV